MTTKTAIERFDIPTESAFLASKKLFELPNTKLKIIADELSEKPVKVKGNKKLQNITLRYYIIGQLFDVEHKGNVFKGVKPTLEDAKERAIALMENLSTGSSTREDVIEEVATIDDEGVVTQVVKRKRTAGTYEAVLDIVRENIDKTRDEIVKIATKEIDGIAENTAIQYFYKAKREMKNGN